MQRLPAGVLMVSFSDRVPGPDRREAERHRTILRVGVLETDAGGRQLCLIKNVSRGGMRACIYARLKPETPVRVEMKNGYRVAGRIVWAKADHVGIAFDRPVPIEEVLSTEVNCADGRHARLPRIECNRLASIRCGAKIHRGRLLDISQGGVKMDVGERLPQGDAIVLLPLLYPVPGTVRWSDGRLAGIGFNEPIPFRRLVEWIKDETGRAVNDCGPAPRANWA